MNQAKLIEKVFIIYNSCSLHWQVKPESTSLPIRHNGINEIVLVHCLKNYSLLSITLIDIYITQSFFFYFFAKCSLHLKCKCKRINSDIFKGNEFLRVGKKSLTTELHIFLSSEKYLMWNPAVVIR